MKRPIIKNGGETYSALKNSVLLRFISDSADAERLLKEYENKLGFNIPAAQKKSFLKESARELKCYTDSNNPAVFYLHKINTKEINSDYFRNYLSGFITQLENEENDNLQIVLPESTDFPDIYKAEEDFYCSCIEGLSYGAYSFSRYKTDKKKDKTFTVYLYGRKKQIDSAIKKSAAVMDGVFLARELANEPSCFMTPDILAKRAGKELSAFGIKVTVLKEKEILKRKMGGVIAVGKGSENPPRFMIFRYLPKKRTNKKVVLVGKGVTFDSGGISIKPAAGMGEMKADMSGAAAVIGGLLAVSKAGLNVEVVGIVPAVENMPSGKSMKPGDIVITSSKKTIEVDNTDAEGRIILADALDFAVKEKPDAIIDLATLTGACVVALGEYTAGLFTNNDELADKLLSAGQDTFERLWRLPLWNDYGKLIKSDVADVKNTGGRWGGAITAAKFLEKFTSEKIPWAHIDIAGPSMPNNLNNYSQKYMTGFGVRLLFRYLEALQLKK